MNEHGLTRKVSKLLAQLTQSEAPVFIKKIAGGRFQESGILDYMGGVGRLFVTFELKAPGTEIRLTPKQQRTLAKCQHMTPWASVFNDYDRFRSWLDHILTLEAGRSIDDYIKTWRLNSRVTAE